MSSILYLSDVWRSWPSAIVQATKYAMGIALSLVKIARPIARLSLYEYAKVYPGQGSETNWLLIILKPSNI